MKLKRSQKLHLIKFDLNNNIDLHNHNYYRNIVELCLCQYKINSVVNSVKIVVDVVQHFFQYLLKK